MTWDGELVSSPSQPAFCEDLPVCWIEKLHNQSDKVCEVWVSGISPGSGVACYSERSEDSRFGETRPFATLRVTLSGDLNVFTRQIPKEPEVFQGFAWIESPEVIDEVSRMLQHYEPDPRLWRSVVSRLSTSNGSHCILGQLQKWPGSVRPPVRRKEHHG